MQWMVDFDTAEKVGMALRIQLDARMRATGFDTIFVYGVGNEPDSTAGLEALFNAHHYNDGLAFVAQGSPTKNTPDVSPAWQVDESEVSYAVEQLPFPVADPQSDTARLVNALGFNAAGATFDRIAHGHDYGGRNGTDMVTALWPATLGYFLQQMMGSTFSYEQIDAGRRWTLDHVVPRGSLPTIRVGRTPYGVLPTAGAAFLSQRKSSPSRASACRVLPKVAERLDNERLSRSPYRSQRSRSGFVARLGHGR